MEGMLKIAGKERKTGGTIMKMRERDGRKNHGRRTKKDKRERKRGSKAARKVDEEEMRK